MKCGRSNWSGPRKEEEVAGRGTDMEREISILEQDGESQRDRGGEYETDKERKRERERQRYREIDR